MEEVVYNASNRRDLECIKLIIILQSVGIMAELRITGHSPHEFKNWFWPTAVNQLVSGMTFGNQLFVKP
jgi:hypothetical protein